MGLREVYKKPGVNSREAPPIRQRYRAIADWQYD